MTPEESKLIDDLFDRLARLEGNQRDPEAEHAIAESLKRAPSAVYALVQTVLVQDEALKRADARIRELTEEPPPPEQHGSFLDTMRNAIGGGARTSVPSVRPDAGGPDPRWNQGGTGYAPVSGSAGSYAAPPQTMPAPGYGGGSFLGTAAATAAGAIGGALLLNSIGSMFGHHGSGSAFGAVPPQGSPWSDSAASSDLARDAGVGDIGGAQGAYDSSQPQGAFDDPGVTDDQPFDDDTGDSDFGDVGGDDTA
jgi:hypothetical protein